MAVRKDGRTRGRVLKDGEDQMPDGRYRYRYKDFNGNRRAVYSWKLLPTDRTPAGKRDSLSLRELEEQIETDFHRGIDGARARTTTLNDLWDAYSQIKEQTLKPSTFANYSYLYDRYIRDTLGRKTLASIKYSTCEAFYRDLVNGKGTSRESGFKLNSLDNIHCVLHPLFEMAVKDDLITKNPTSGLMADIKKLYGAEDTKRHALTVEQQRVFVSYTARSATYSHWMPLFTFLLGTGCRIGEALGLTWNECDFKNNRITIANNLIYRQHTGGSCQRNITTPKTAAGIRTIPMMSEVKNALLSIRDEQIRTGVFFNSTAVVDGYTGFVFLNRYGDVLTPASVNRAIVRISTEANAEEAALARREGREPVVIPHFSAHHLRHTFCTRLCENETNIKAIQEIMGHSDISTTMNIYAEATEGAKQAALANLEGKVKIS